MTALVIIIFRLIIISIHYIVISWRRNMRTNWHKALLVSFVLITSSLAGCLDNDDDDDEKLEGKYGTVIVSTYHIEQMVSAIVGDTVNVEMMSTNNIPVHDYAPTPEDIIRLSESDLFLYHGLGLETWVEDALDSLGSDAPESASTHAMPTGEVNLDYESMLINDLCKLLAGGPYESLYLSFDEDDVSEIHAEPVTHSIEAAEHEDDHDDHGDDDHDDHGDDDHDEHDGHDDHGGDGHTEAEEVITNPEGCPADSVIQVFHLEEGEYVIEFESEHHDYEFDLAVLKMLGGHAHHDHHGHGDDHGDEEEENEDEHHGECHDTTTHEDYDSTEEECEAAGHVWMEEGHDEDGHDEHHGVCHDTTTHENYDSTEEECEAAGHVWMEEDHDEHGHDEEPTPEEVLEMYDTNNDSSISWDEFWASWEDDHHDEHDGHDEHEEMHHNLVVLYPDNSSVILEEEHDVLSEDTTANDFTMHLLDMNSISYDITEGSFGNFTNSIGGFEGPSDYSWWWQLHTWNDSAEAWEESMLGMDSVKMEEAEHIAWAPNSTDDSLIPTPEHDDDHGEMVCYDMSTHTVVEIDNLSDCEAAGMMWVEMTSEDHDDHDDDCHNEHTEEEEMSMLMSIFNESDADSNALLDSTELETFIPHVSEFAECHEEIDEDVMGYAIIHVMAEGEYGFAHSSELEISLMAYGGGHDDHSDHDYHSGHDDHDDHGDEDGHDDHGDEDGHDDEDNSNSGLDIDDLSYDPHSWLDPVAYKIQVEIVLELLIETFPDGEDVFTENAEDYMDKLDTLHIEFDTTINSGVCTDKTVAANHNAYSYMAYRYDIQFVTVHGLDPEGEPSPADVAKVVEFINEEKIDLLFVEEYTDQSSVQSIVDETDVEVKILYTMEMAPSDSDDDYMSMMYKNLENLAAGMSC